MSLNLFRSLIIPNLQVFERKKKQQKINFRWFSGVAFFAPTFKNESVVKTIAEKEQPLEFNPYIINYCGANKR